MTDQWLAKKMDEIYSGEGEVPIVELLDPPLNLPLPGDVADDAAAGQLLEDVLERLSAIHVAVEVCDHFSPRELYKYVFEAVLRDGLVHPDLPSTGVIEHYTAWDSCPTCQAESEEGY